MPLSEPDLFDEPDSYGTEGILPESYGLDASANYPEGSPLNTDTAAIDEEVTINARSRIAVKLDEDKLIGDRGIPYLRRKVQKLQFKKKNYEYRDLSKILEFYKLWSHKLYPKATFKDFVQISEKIGKTTRMKMYRRQWIEEDKQNDENIMEQYSKLTPSFNKTVEQESAISNTSFDGNDNLPRFTGTFSGFKLSSSQPPGDNGLFIPPTLQDAQPHGRFDRDQQEDFIAEDNLNNSVKPVASKTGARRFIVEEDDSDDNHHPAKDFATTNSPVKTGNTQIIKKPINTISPFEIEGDVPDMNDLIELEEELVKANKIQSTGAHLSNLTKDYLNKDNDEDQLTMDLAGPTIFSEKAQSQQIASSKPLNHFAEVKKAQFPEMAEFNDNEVFDDEMDVLRDLGF
ncbi:Swi3-domain-containing protein [Nadsonia fulvescens var. elongata DSM 6958]|uniref:Chromosome segregation in meiosis protein n=1 Tax=Nadsonia fulvescens var. elongata DSM 6958 TaxID=857566 RepID=A0A1E3PRJ6_9ASCO|nr:Swi3-domain-containing protein [Nadsonia fulvescens var. elongata DSM 6958]